MILAYGQGSHYLLHQRISLSDVLFAVSTLLSDLVYTFNSDCLSAQLKAIYFDVESSSYSMFRHLYDTLEYQLYYVDRHCLQAEALSIHPVYYDEAYSAFVLKVKNAMLETGYDLLEPRKVDWWKVIHESGYTPLSYPCLEETMKLFGVERPDPIDCFHKSVIPYEENII